MFTASVADALKVGIDFCGAHHKAQVRGGFSADKEPAISGNDRRSRYAIGSLLSRGLVHFDLKRAGPCARSTNKTAQWIISSTRLPMCSSRYLSSSSSSSKCRFMFFAFIRTAVARDVILGFLVFGICENSFGDAILDQIAKQHERGVVRRARRLLHVVSDDHDSQIFFQLEQQFFDARAVAIGSRRRARLIEQAIPAGSLRERARCRAVAAVRPTSSARNRSACLSLRPTCQAAPRRLFSTAFGEQRLVANAVENEPGRDVLKNGHRRKRVWALEYHAVGPSGAAEPDPC